MARPYPWKCRSCGEKALGPAVVDYPATMEHDGRPYSFVVPGLHLLECVACHERVLPDDAFEQVLARLRAEAGLLTPADIRERRKRLGLTQEQLAAHLSVAKETVSRWETGGQIQQRAFDKLLRVYFDLSAVRDYLAGRQPLFSLTSDPPVARAGRAKPWVAAETNTVITGFMVPGGSTLQYGYARSAGDSPLLAVAGE